MNATHHRFNSLLKRRIGLDADAIGQAAIERAVRLRSAANGLHGNDEGYWTHLQSHPAEVQALIEAVVVPETWFFRYPASFDALAGAVRERFKDRERIRILSLPCATGEEPYSIVMALQDAGLPPERITVDAVDISEQVLDVARRAVYGQNAFRGDAPGLLRERYFTPTARGQALSPRVTGSVRLRQGNLFDPLLPARAAPYDVVFCRNLLIYFDAPTQKRAVDVLTRLVQPDGLLFVGPAEASLLTRQGMRSIGRANAFAFSLAQTPAPVPAHRAWPAVDASVRAVPSAPTRAHSAAKQAIRSMASAPGPGPVRDTPTDAAVELQRLADLGRLDDALAACERWLAANGPSADAFYFQGLLHDAAGRPQQAQAGYRKALYLDPAHSRALLQLSALLASQGDIEGARRMKARATRREREHG